MLLKRIILLCKLRIKNDRSIAAIYYLLIGEKSIQTVQDAHIYKIDQFYGIYKTIKKIEFEQIIEELVSEQLLIVIANNEKTNYVVSEKGEKWIKENHYLDEQLAYFRGIPFEQLSLSFLNRLYLFIQVLTNSKMNDTSYIPINDDPQTVTWLKKTYQKIKNKIDIYLNSLNDELYSLLSDFPNREAAIFVDRLTGYRKYGLSIEQIVDKYKLDNHSVRLLLTGMSHQILEQVSNQTANFPLLNFIISDIGRQKQTNLTQSAKTTNKLINNGRSLEEIAKIRNLTINTVYDHIVEIAIYDRSFPITQFVNQTETTAIIRALKQNKTFKLREIKAMIDEQISYFQIRLVLTRLDNLNEIR